MTAPPRPAPGRRTRAPAGGAQRQARLPSVGVVVATRDRPHLLRRAIDGVLAQDYPGPVRLVVVYDGSPPDYLLAQTGERAVLVLVNWHAPGLAGARNTGILALDSDLVAFCDDDDVWAPTKLSRQVAALTARPGAEFATCAIEVEYEGRVNRRLAGTDVVALPDLVRSRMAMLHASGFLVARRCLLDADEGVGLVAEDAPGRDRKSVV